VDPDKLCIEAAHDSLCEVRKREASNQSIFFIDVLYLPSGQDGRGGSEATQLELGLR
jgi:hypothetical protein